MVYFIWSNRIINKVLSIIIHRAHNNGTETCDVQDNNSDPKERCKMEMEQEGNTTETNKTIQAVQGAKVVLIYFLHMNK